MCGKLGCVLVILCVLDYSDAGIFPPDVTVCSAKDPNLNQCFMDSANKMIKHLLPGIKKMNAVPMEPLMVPLLGLQKGNYAVPSMAFNLTNTTHYGWKDAHVSRARADPNNYSFDMTIGIPYYELVGDYAVDGSILFLMLYGQGKVNMKFFDNTYNVSLYGEPVHHDNGNTHLRVKNVTINSHIPRINFNLTNLFNNQYLSSAANSLINWNQRVLLQEGTGMMDIIFSELYEKLTQRIFDRVPYNMMFRDLTMNKV